MTLSSPPKSFCVSFFSARGCSGNLPRGGERSTKGPMWGLPVPVLGAISPFLEPFRGRLSPNIDNFSEKLTLSYPHEGPWVEGGPTHTVAFDPFIKKHLASRNQLWGLKQCKFGHVKPKNPAPTTP